MLPLDPTPPFARLGRLAENADEVPVRVAHPRPFLLYGPEDLFQAHDRRRLFVTLRARPRFQECERLFPLLLVQFVKPNALAQRLLVAVLLGGEEPPGPVGVVE